MNIHIGIVDDHELILDGIEKMIDQFRDFHLWGRYRTAEALRRALVINQPDILLMDLQLPDLSGNELLRILCAQYPDLKIVALTSMDSLFNVKDMMHHGCKGYVTKQASGDILPEAIRRVFAGEEYIEPELKQRWTESIMKAERHRYQAGPLSLREEEILKLIALEFTTQEIADKLFLSQRTVDSHRYSLMQKLNVKNAAGLVRLAVQMGLVD